ILYALSQAEGKGTEIIFLNVQPNYNTPYVKRFISPEEVRKIQEEASQEVFKHSLELTKNSSLPIITVLRTGDPGREICKFAQESAVDAIVMGYRGLGAVKRAIFGSVANHVLHEAPCPITVIP
ncbi:MAG: universal stress protein, partial [Desulfitobacterium sp.]|nr:universal stress protein [Desulfitobacterium sp.]